MTIKCIINSNSLIFIINKTKKTKKETVMIEVRWYYRPNEIPDGVYTLLMQDRFHENSSKLVFVS